jgi:hypothetical protein
MKRALSPAVLVAFACGVIATLVVSLGWRIATTDELRCIQVGDFAPGERVHVVREHDEGSGCSQNQLCLHEEVGALGTKVDATDCYGELGPVGPDFEPPS